MLFLRKPAYMQAWIFLQNLWGLQDDWVVTTKNRDEAKMSVFFRGLTCVPSLKPNTSHEKQWLEDDSMTFPFEMVPLSFIFRGVSFLVWLGFPWVDAPLWPKKPHPCNCKEGWKNHHHWKCSRLGIFTYMYHMYHKFLVHVGKYSKTGSIWFITNFTKRGLLSTFIIHWVFQYLGRTHVVIPVSFQSDIRWFFWAMRLAAIWVEDVLPEFSMWGWYCYILVRKEVNAWKMHHESTMYFCILFKIRGLFIAHVTFTKG